MFNFAVIGVGGIGKRHLESILQLEIPYQVYVIDSNEGAVENAVGMNKEKIVGGKDVSILPDEIDVAIIATSSGVRRKVFEELISKAKVKNVIFEKVLFQKSEDYLAVEKLLKEHKVNAWVNCIRRENHTYIELKEIVDGCKSFSCQIAGGNWGLGCNGIHMLDFIQFLSGSDKCKIAEINLFPYVVESKRAGYKEVFGALYGNCGKCQAFSINCYEDSTLPMNIEVAGNNFRAIIFENKSKMLLMREANGWQVEEKDVEALYVSQTTKKIIDSIIHTGECNLPKYDESMQLHLKYIERLTQFFEEQGLEKGICPIT